jgi:D-alanyl-D-alanine carboxypeptidase
MVPGAPTTDAIAAAVIADSTPAPEPKPRVIDTSRPVVTASLVGANSDFAADATDDGQGDLDDDRATPKAAAPKFAITVKPIRRASDSETALAPVVVAAAEAEEAANALPASSEGWKIQLAATPDKASAKKILKSARAKAGKLLADTKSYTQSVVKDDVTLYRARISGFENKEAARAACTFLVEQKFSCLALSD